MSFSYTHFVPADVLEQVLAWILKDAYMYICLYNHPLVSVGELVLTPLQVQNLWILEFFMYNGMVFVYNLRSPPRCFKSSLPYL